MQDSGSRSLINAIWLCMRWHDIDVPTAKSMVREATNKYEKRFQNMSETFRQTHAPLSDKLDCYLRALAYQISGNVVWSLNCPRYHPEYRYDPNAGLQTALLFEPLAEAEHPGHPTASTLPPRRQDFLASTEHSRKCSFTDSIASNFETAGSSIENDRSSATSHSTSPDLARSPFNDCSKRALLDPDVSVLRGYLDIAHQCQLIQAPFRYVNSMPSKGLRETFIDALNIWLHVPESYLVQIKRITSLLHTASLL
jgi:hypothetical protein